MDILLTGASGFIGGALLRRMLQDGYAVIAMGRKFPKMINSEQVIYFEGEYSNCNLESIEQKIDSHLPQVFIHTAGLAHIAPNEQNKDLFEQNNVRLTADMLALAKQLGIKKFIFFSSVSVLNDDKDDIYARTKRMAEELVIKMSNEMAIPYVIVRPVMVYGENDIKGNMAKLIRQLDRGFFPLFNRGQNKKEILYVQNLVETVIEIIKSDRWNNQTILLKDPQTITMYEICQIVVETLGHRCVMFPVPRWTNSLLISGLKMLQKTGSFSTMNANSIRRLSLDEDFCHEMDEEFARLMPYSCIQGLERTVKGYLNNKDG